MMTYEEASQLPSSEKISLVICEAIKPVKLFTLYSGTTYLKTVPHFVGDVKNSGVSLSLGYDEDSLDSGDYYFDAVNKTLYVNVGQDPKFESLSLVYKFFFSNTPLILPYDLNNGVDVEFLPYIRNISSIGQQLDDENSGIVLESQSSVEFLNNHGFFDSIVDSYIFENQSINFYSWFNNLPRSEIKKIFDGVIESKSFAPDKVSFSVKDYVFKLRNVVNLGLFSESDGNLLESIIGTPKRRIYGQVKQAKCIPLDCTLDGYDLTGTISLTTGSDIMTGTGTQFLKELNQDDDIIFIYNNEEIVYSVDLISSDTSLKLSKKAEQTVANISVKVDPEYPYRFKNRLWHIAGHKIRQTQAVITNIINARTYVVDDVSEFVPGDVVRVLGQTTQVTRVSGDQIILEQNIFPIPIIGNIIARYPITKLHYGEREFIPFRDFTLSNTTEAIIELGNDAEFNIARETVTDHNLSFKDGFYDVSSSANADLRTIIKPGDFIRPTIQNNENWYEVHHVGPQVVWLKTVFSNSGSNSNHPARVKKMDVVSDDSLIMVDCYGKETDNTWMKTASDCVKDLVVNDAGFTSIDTSSFIQAKSDCPYTLSLVFPEVGGKAPPIRDVITLINESIFGSLYGNSSQEIAYSIVNTRRPETMQSIKDDDILSWSVDTTQKIASNVKINYLPAVDKITGEDGFSVVTFENSFVTDNIGIQNTIEKTCYLFNQSEAETIAQRVAFYNSLSRSILNIKAKANFFTASVNDRIYVDLDRLYSRYGGANRLKIGVISGVKKSPYGTEIEMNDLGNIFNRCPAIAPDATDNFTNSSEDEKIKFGYILDPDTLIPGIDEEDLGSGLIG